ncbi:MAG: hypothetical protein ACLFVD_05260 [Dehalococcoidia bacterium]
MSETFMMKLDRMQPSQLFISSAKLAQVMRDFGPLRPDSLAPIPVKELGGKVIMTDGHTRALAALLAGLTEIRVVWDEDDLDWEEYDICVHWCEEEGIHTIADLKDRIVSPVDYQRLWRDRCQAMHEELEQA